METEKPHQNRGIGMSEELTSAEKELIFDFLDSYDHWEAFCDFCNCNNESETDIYTEIKQKLNVKGA